MYLVVLAHPLCIVGCVEEIVSALCHHSKYETILLGGEEKETGQGDREGGKREGRRGKL